MTTKPKTIRLYWLERMAVATKPASGPDKYPEAVPLDRNTVLPEWVDQETIDRFISGRIITPYDVPVNQK